MCDGTRNRLALFADQFMPNGDLLLTAAPIALECFHLGPENSRHLGRRRDCEFLKLRSSLVADLPHKLHRRPMHYGHLGGQHRLERITWVDAFDDGHREFDSVPSKTIGLDELRIKGVEKIPSVIPNNFISEQNWRRSMRIIPVRRRDWGESGGSGKSGVVAVG